MVNLLLNITKTCQNGGVLEWLEHHMLPCPSKYFFHFDCPGCGMQRSLFALIQGDFVKSLQLYPATIPVLFLVCFAAVHLKMELKNGAAIIKWTQFVCAAIIIVSYIYKVVTHKIF